MRGGLISQRRVFARLISNRLLLFFETLTVLLAWSRLWLRLILSLTENWLSLWGGNRNWLTGIICHTLQLLFASLSAQLSLLTSCQASWVFFRLISWLMLIFQISCSSAPRIFWKPFSNWRGFFWEKSVKSSASVHSMGIPLELDLHLF